MIRETFLRLVLRYLELGDDSEITTAPYFLPRF